MARGKRGHFIVIEGTDGSGKATQVRQLRKKLQILGIRHQVMEFPRYTGNPYGRLIGDYLKGDFGSTSDVNSSLISLAYAGDRALAKPQIESWLQDGELVIADRYVSSNKAYMAAKLSSDKRQEFIDWLDDLEYNINQIPREELTIFLYVPSEITSKNVNKRPSGKGAADIHERDLEYQKMTSSIYLKMAKEEGWAVIECIENGEMKPPSKIHREIFNVLVEKGIIDG